MAVAAWYPFKLNPVLDPLDQIECRDALMNADGSEAVWPQVNVVVGNPPFVGDKKMRAELGDAYTDALREAYKGRVPGGADLVTYWFERARLQIEQLGLGAAGLVATQAIRSGFNIRVLDQVVATTPIFAAWSDEPWVNEGASVRVSLVCFGHSAAPPELDGREVEQIAADLSQKAVDSLDNPVANLPTETPSNADAAFRGVTRNGEFQIGGDEARAFLRAPNPDGRSNADVVRPLVNGMDITDRKTDRWVVDFGCEMSASEAMLYELPFKHVERFVRPERESNRREVYRQQWWRFAEARPALRRAIHVLDRYVVTPMVAKHRVFAFFPRGAMPEQRLIAIARSDDSLFGVLGSRFHSSWSLRWGGVHGDGADGGRPVYNVAACFETFPFPAGLTPADTAHQRTESLPEGELIPADLPPAIRPHAEAIAHAAKRLNDLRERWLNPPEWTRREPEVVPLGMDRSPYPDRILPRDGFEKPLAQRTLTKLYNERPAWLAQAHEALDAAVAAAYGWADYRPQMPDEEILRRLLALNRERSEAAR